jgi:hypothetical protein
MFYVALRHWGLKIRMMGLFGSAWFIKTIQRMSIDWLIVYLLDSDDEDIVDAVHEALSMARGLSGIDDLDDV